ncbi:RNA polymerase sigma-70 factor, ECF subfamily [Rubritalea squalenifaciens DSM 18772]|uniref:RNA polymerase sigma-70 factor, ECF subfamily n=2 Tax=Rubritalea TaxID=361050 RepID=A0A1M6PF95_9BACT|nr:sigma-70 family RNA polymerase sigma factor [Rubritalea squalenifaciens]SHK06638.1 RNA polymerase sigma-70 factor, ECF subfamily [Rubritalea squalenifaciens DSM 18772]
MTTAEGNSTFQPTRWTLVQRVKDACAGEAQEALNELCGMYWKPLYAYARGYGRSMEDAEDVVQGFMAKGVEKALFAAADREKGKMRTFLLTAFKRYLRDEHAKSIAVKRGEGKVDTMDIAAEEARWEDSDAEDPTLSFDKRWALIVVESAREQLRKKYYREGKEDFYEALAQCLTGELDGGYQEVADQLGVSLSSVKVGVHRMRKRFGEMLRAEILETIGEGEDPDDELKYLIAVLSD